MEIEVNILGKFLRKIAMKDSIESLILDFEKDKLNVIAITLDNVAIVEGCLYSKCFKNYEDFGKIGIGDFSNFIKILDKFNVVKIKKRELFFSGSLLTNNIKDLL